MLKEDIKKMLDTRKAQFKMELKGSDLTPFTVEQIIEMFLYTEYSMENGVSEYQEVFDCGCFYMQEYDPTPHTLEWLMDHILDIKDNIKKLEFIIYYDDESDSMGSPTIYVDRSDICEDCLENDTPERVAELKEVMRPDSLLQNAVYSHGLATGFGSNQVSVETAEGNFMSLLNLRWEETEICCSWKSQQIGGFGMFVRGEVTVASNKDLWSYVGSDGSREFNPDENEKYLISRRDELDLSVWDHTEFFVKPKEFIAFWAKDWFIKDVPGGREFVNKLRKMGHKVYITRRRHR